MKKLVVLTGSGMSAESGIPTFRDANGLWEGHDVTEVASPEGWENDPEKVLAFYNERRKKLLEVSPNAGHQHLAALEKYFDVTIITQNIDDLHERAGSPRVFHLHGELLKSRSTVDDQLIYPIEGSELKLGDVCEKGSQLRPHVVWFGEMVPMMDIAIQEILSADIFLVVGTSLQVYPAAGLINYAPDHIPVFLVDPKVPYTAPHPHLHPIPEKAGTGMVEVRKILLEKYT